MNRINFSLLFFSCVALILLVVAQPISSSKHDYSEVICTNETGKRCEGSMLVAFGQVKIPHPPKQKIQYLTPEQCEGNCTKTPWCEMAMYLKKSRKHHHSACYLYTEVGFSTHGNNRTIFHWACCKKNKTSAFPYDEEDSLVYIPDNEKCRSLSGRCQGRWTKTERYFSASSMSGAQFHTTANHPTDCIKHCIDKPHCSKIYFREKDGACLYKEAKEEKGSEINENNRWDVYQWECC